MEDKNKKPNSRRVQKWFKIRKQKRKDAYRIDEPSEREEEDDESGDYIGNTSLQINSCSSTEELRVFVGTWNVAGRSPVGSLAVDLDEWLNLKEAADIYVLGLQEVVPLITRTVIGAEDSTEATNWNLLIGIALNHKYGCPWLNPITSDRHSFDSTSDSKLQTSSTCTDSKYKLIASKKMVGVFISVWMKTELLKKYSVSNVKVCSVACGIMGVLGNKGSVSVSITIEGTSFCFIAAHLASGEKKGNEERRNHQVSEIFRRTLFPRSSKSHLLTILGHDQIFWFGDLNYRLYLEDKLARRLIRQQDWKSLQQFDQLRREQENGGVFQGWKEGNIEFAPTYKYSSSNCNRYSGGLPSRTGEKQRTPAWCDRILWYGKGVEQLSYFRSESRFSDHRPVSALFSTQIEFINSTSPRSANINTLLPNITTTENTGTIYKEVKSTLQTSIVKDGEAIPNTGRLCKGTR